MTFHCLNCGDYYSGYNDCSCKKEKYNKQLKLDRIKRCTAEKARSLYWSTKGQGKTTKGEEKAIKLAILESERLFTMKEFEARKVAIIAQYK